MFERFTSQLRRVVVLAQEEARSLKHDHIGTAHLLLGLLREGEGVASIALVSLGVSLDAARRQVKEIVGTGKRTPGGHIPFTPSATKVMELSRREAEQLGQDSIGTEHLLLALTRECDGVGMQVLIGLGVDLERAREAVAGFVPAGSDGGGTSETERLRDEVARLRRLLEQHGIDPDAADAAL